MISKTFPIVLLLCLLLTGCGPSNEELTATAVSLTETARPTTTNTPLPTVTPTFTPLPSPTPAAGKDCKIVSLEPVASVEVPTIQIQAEGFLPNEGRMIEMTGKAVIGGAVQSIPTILAGGNGESADSEGRISETVALILKPSLDQFEKVTGKWIFPDQTLSVTVTGKKSGCEAVKTVAWP